jgi:hypothetical protein
MIPHVALKDYTEHDLHEPIPPGKTLLPDGRVIPTIERVFLMAESKSDPSILGTMDGVVYRKDAHGTLRRLTPKKGKR